MVGGLKLDWSLTTIDFSLPCGLILTFIFNVNAKLHAAIFKY